MKLSNKIILSIAAIMVALMIISLLMIRKDMKNLIAESGIEYETEEYSEFRNLDISDHWNVRIKQGRTHKVEIAREHGSIIEPLIENRNDTLFLRLDTNNLGRNIKPVKVRITTRSLKSVRAVENSIVRMDNFNVDTLNVILYNGGSFSAKNNQLNYVSFETSGNSNIDITETMD